MIGYRILGGALLGASLFFLGACGSASEDDSPGSLSLRVTDAPVDTAEAVVVEFTGVTVQPASGERLEFDFAQPRSIDLLALSGGDSQLLFTEPLRAGEYTWVRLKVQDGDVSAPDTPRGSYLTVGGEHHALRIPSGDQSGLQLNRGFTVPAGGAVDFTIDFDLRRSVHLPPGQGGDYLLRPSLRLVETTQVGSIGGTVADAPVADPACLPAVYVFSGAGVVPDDVDGAEPEPLTSALVMRNLLTQQWEYTAAFLSPGTYTVALTCQAGADAPGADDPSVTFTGTATIDVQAGAAHQPLEPQDCSLRDEPLRCGPAVGATPVARPGERRAHGDDLPVLVLGGGVALLIPAAGVETRHDFP
ncbi:MAG: DUF4382 domain-containing protein [Proteobacteria bacterium]|nr:DUF4382 domain-containing protein [Pseudomonadota bacterium]